MTSIREVDPERDAAAVVALRREVAPNEVVSVASWIHAVDSIPGRAEQRRWVAEVDGAVVANGWALRNFFSEGSTAVMCSVNVAPAHRRRGIGNALFELVEEHAAWLAGESLTTTFHENDQGVAFAAGHGFREARAETDAVLDPRAVTELPRADVDLRPVSAVDPRLAYEVDIEATRDMPSLERIDLMPYDEWVGFVLENPLFAADGSFVALVDGVAAALSLVIADVASGRSHNMFTGTLRAYRGRGLALAVKLASIRWAREHGITSMSTHNDETNAPMLAVNRRLGYRPAGRRVEWIRAGTASS
jgi:GNAT superfamily N-acetyltransferase